MVLQELLGRIFYSFLSRAFNLPSGFLVKILRKMRKKKKISRNFKEIPSGFEGFSQKEEGKIKKRRDLLKKW